MRALYSDLPTVGNILDPQFFSIENWIDETIMQRNDVFMDMGGEGVKVACKILRENIRL